MDSYYWDTTGRSLNISLYDSRTEGPAVCSLNKLNTYSRLASLRTERLISTTAVQSQDHDTLYKSLTVEIKGHDPEVISSYEKFVRLTAKELDLTFGDVETAPKVIKRWSLLKSVHVHKKHFVQYETRTHFRMMELKRLTGSSASAFLEYIQRNLPEGMTMKVTKTRLEKIPDHIEPPNVSL